MLYMVECGFRDPSREAAWSEWYSGPKLASLLALPGFDASQRFHALDDGPAPWLAVHTVPGTEFFDRANYRGAGGGGFGAWQADIIDWSRNLFDGRDTLPEVPEDAFLVTVDAEDEPAAPPGFDLDWLRGAGLDCSVAWRGWAIAGTPDRPPGGRVWRPVTRRLTGS